ncbi:Ti-type conjugative transfer relaxase TraA [Epibacterium ulvae]|uniref:Ti-type conjugative transfer relaxase TraA n=2 Tax=Epibacterium ulvae TaxID=1156985 RepID=A0A1G5RIS7_9RHOB|nr:AAA family ATPase [Epibacterium ulvae]SCZ73947.1 Ti-type conjugative transfer relaxase TraA [Epibacterium ulvae]
MILEANARGYGAELARHLMNPRDNDHVTLHRVEGFLSHDLASAFAEVEMIASGTRCRKYLFSMSFNPPLEANVPIEVFEQAISDAEARLGLSGQPRAIVFHEKNGRRHAHCVWSRIDPKSMTAIQLPHFKRKLMGLSREIYQDQGWDMPDGFKRFEDRDPLNYSRQEAGQAKRADRDPKALKAKFQSCWAQSDDLNSFAAALQEEGFLLARGSRRGFVAVDGDGKIWSLSRWCGVRPKDLRQRLGSEDRLPSVEDVLSQAKDLPAPKKQKSSPLFQKQRDELVIRQRQEREALIERQIQRQRDRLLAQRQSAGRGLRALFDRMTGQDVVKRDKVLSEAKAAKATDRAEQQALITRHLAERRALDQHAHERSLQPIFGRSTDPEQRLQIRPEALPYTAKQLRKDPALVLDHISQKKADFTRTDVLRALAQVLPDPMELQAATRTAMASGELVPLQSTSTLQPRFTTKDYQKAEAQLNTSATKLKEQGGFQVQDQHITRAMADQDRRMMQDFGGKLSQEQRGALHHVLGDNHMASVVGLAGAGKSTLLDTARMAWEQQGLRVHGAALAGKAAEGLEGASGIPSRTLASLELSWKNGHSPISKGDVLVVDEAGMIGTRQLARITKQINEIGAKLVLVGDPEQLQPIEAGTPFRDLVKQYGAARLTEIHRQKADWHKQASKDLAEGRSHQALTRYAEKQAVTTNTSKEEAIDHLAASYVMDVAAHGARKSRLALAHKRKDVHALNQAIRAQLR